MYDTDLAILELMDRYDESFDEASAHYARLQQQRELAADRKRASEIKAAMTKNKQRRFREAAHPYLPSEKYTGNDNQVGA